MNFKIIPIQEQYIDGFREAVGEVSREKKYLIFTDTPPKESTLEFVENIIKNRYPQFVAIIDSKVIGWCDVIPKTRGPQKHIGVLGMGIVSQYRGLGIGKMLLEKTIKASKEFGLEKIELGVFKDNIRAKNLYEKFGFFEEGLKKKSVKIDGNYVDEYIMGLFL